MEGDVRVLLQPGFDIVGLVRGQVVQHDVDLLVRVRLDRLLEERQELGAVAGGGAVPEHLTGSHVQGCEQVGGAVAYVVGGALLGDTERDRQHRLGSIQCLVIRGKRSCLRVFLQVDRLLTGVSGSKSWPWCLTCGFKLRGAGWLSSRGIRSRIWTCQPVTWTSSTMRRSRACFWSKSSVSITAMTRVAKSRTRGWCATSGPVSSATFAYLSAYTWARVIGWLRPQTPPGHLETTPPPLLRWRMVAGHNRSGAVQPGEGAHHALPIPGRSDPRCVAGHRMRTTPAETGLVERLLLGNGHGGCGRRLGETHRWKHRQGAPGRPHRPATRAPSATEPARRGRARLRVPARTRRRHRHHLRRDRRA